MEAYSRTQDWQVRFILDGRHEQIENSIETDEELEVKTSPRSGIYLHNHTAMATFDDMNMVDSET